MHRGNPRVFKDLRGYMNFPWGVDLHCQKDRRADITFVRLPNN